MVTSEHSTSEGSFCTVLWGGALCDNTSQVLVAPGGDPAWHTTNAPSGLRKGCVTPHGLADGSPFSSLLGRAGRVASLGEKLLRAECLVKPLLTLDYSAPGRGPSTNE